MTDFEKIYSENQNFIFRFLLKMCGDESLAEELTQETFFRAYMNVASLKNKEKAPVWLCSIAKNVYFAWYNGNKKERRNAMPHENLEADVQDCVIQKVLAGEAMKKLHELDEPYKEVFMLAVLGEVSLKEISAIFGKSESWARVTFYRAKQKLAEKLEGFR